MRENLLQGPRILFDEDWNFIGLNGRDQFDIGSQNSHPDYNDGTANNYSQDLIRAYAVDDSFTYLKSGWRGDHTFKGGCGLEPEQRVAADDRRQLDRDVHFPDQHGVRSRRTRARIRGGSDSVWVSSTTSSATGAPTSTCRTSGRSTGSHAEPRRAVRLPAHHAAGEGRVRATVRRGVRPHGQREDGHSRRRREVLPAPAAQRPGDASAVGGHRPAFVYDTGQVAFAGRHRRRPDERVPAARGSGRPGGSEPCVPHLALGAA